MSELWNYSYREDLIKTLCSLGYHAWIAVKFHYSPDVIMKKGKEKDFVMRCKYCDSSLPMVKRHAITGKTEDCLLKEKDE